MTAWPYQHRTLHLSRINFAAVLSAVPCARMFSRAALRHWDLADHADEAELITSELVGNAVKATGVTEQQAKSWHVTARHVIGVQLRVIDTDLYVEVWDSDTAAPVKRTAPLDAEGGRGLLLVEAMCQNWDVYRPEEGGKVVWARLALSHSARPLPGRPQLTRRVPGATAPPTGEVTRLADAALLQRVLEGLRSR